MAPGSERFSQRERMRTQWEFDQVRQYGLSANGRFLIINVSRVSGTRRIGFITSKRIGNAVTRNRIKRRLREVCRMHLFDLATDIWLVLIARPAVTMATYHDIEYEFLQLYQTVMRKLP